MLLVVLTITYELEDLFIIKTFHINIILGFVAPFTIWTSFRLFWLVVFILIALDLGGLLTRVAILRFLIIGRLDRLGLTRLLIEKSKRILFNILFFNLDVVRKSDRGRLWPVLSLRNGRD